MGLDWQWMLGPRSWSRDCAAVPAMLSATARPNRPSASTAPAILQDIYSANSTDVMHIRPTTFAAVIE